MHKSRLELNKSAGAGMSILDLSIHLMYGFYWSTIKKQYRENCDLLYTDTDSFLLEVKTEDTYKDMEQAITEHNTSDNPKDHYLHSMENKKVGKMKDECAGQYENILVYIITCIVY